MKKFFFQILALLIVISGMLYVAFQGGTPLNLKPIPSAQPSEGPVTGLKKLRIIDNIPNQDFKTVKAILNIEISDTQEKRSKGLGGRDFLASDSGMLFIHDKKSKLVYWMKGMKIPLDILWIDGDRIVDILTKIPPPNPEQSDDNLQRFGPTIEVDKVLEVNSGFTDSHGIKVGDKIEFISD